MQCELSCTSLMNLIYLFWTWDIYSVIPLLFLGNEEWYQDCQHFIQSCTVQTTSGEPALKITASSQTRCYSLCPSYSATALLALRNPHPSAEFSFLCLSLSLTLTLSSLLASACCLVPNHSFHPVCFKMCLVTSPL